MADDRPEPHGMLAPVDREYLYQKDEYGSRQAIHNRKRAIRTRVRNTILDFTLVFERLAHEEREEIFGQKNITPQIRYDDPAFEEGLRDTLAFVLEGSGAVGLFDPVPDTRDDTTAGRLFESALDRLALRYGYNLESVSVDVDAERIPVNRLMEELDQGHELPPEHLTYLLRQDEVDTEEIQTRIREMVFEDGNNE